MNLPNVSDAVVAALIAGAFALVTQAVVKVWEVRQARRDNRASIYIERLNVMRRIASDMGTLLRMQEGLAPIAVHLNSLQLSRPSLTSEELKTVTQKLRELVDRLQKTLSEYSQAQASIKVRIEELADQNPRFQLYAGVRLQRADQQVIDLMANMVEKDSLKRVTAAEVQHKMDRFIRLARLEMRASGSIGFSVLWYTIVSISVTVAHQFQRLLAYASK